jgi:hypothetical protein
MTKNKVFIVLLIVALTMATKTALSWSNAASPMSLCKIALNPKTYVNETVNIRANLYSYSSGVMHLNGIECGPRSDAWATLEFNSSFLPTGMTQQFLGSIRDVKEQGEYKMAEVRLTGRIEDLERQCFGPRFVLNATQIEQISEISSGKIEDGIK